MKFYLNRKKIPTCSTGTHVIADFTHTGYNGIKAITFNLTNDNKNSIKSATQSGSELDSKVANNRSTSSL